MSPMMCKTPVEFGANLTRKLLFVIKIFLQCVKYLNYDKLTCAYNKLYNKLMEV